MLQIRYHCSSLKTRTRPGILVKTFHVYEWIRPCSAQTVQRWNNFTSQISVRHCTATYFIDIHPQYRQVYLCSWWNFPCSQYTVQQILIQTHIGDVHWASPNITVEWLLLFHIRKVSSSNPGPKTGYVNESSRVCSQSCRQMLRWYVLPQIRPRPLPLTLLLIHWWIQNGSDDGVWL
jgi:hypothetical protein